MKNKIAFIVPYPKGIAPSQRFRFEQYFLLLEENNYEVSFYPFFTEGAYHLIYQPGKILIKSGGVFLAFFKRFLLMFQLKHYDIVFIHREASPIGPPVFEWIIAKLLKKKIVYDFDDAIWLENTSQSNQFISAMKRHSKVASISKWSALILCGNHYLMTFAKKHNANVVYMPTTIDTENGHNQIKEHKSGVVTIGWTGTHSTIKYLYAIEGVLFKLQQELNFKFVVISDQEPLFKGLEYSFVPWNKKTEIKDLLSFDVGIMPLLDNDWAKGKCGFKALQYMALGIPCVISPVGVNTEIIQDGINGFLANDEDEWIEKISKLIDSQELRNRIGVAGRKTVLDRYSVRANQEKYLRSFKALFKK